jgi:hypothetical protein
MGCSVGRDPLIRTGLDSYILQLNHLFWVALAPLESPSAQRSLIQTMTGLSILRRSSSGAHPLQPANHSPGTIIVSFGSLSTLFAWTFGSGTVVCSSYLFSHFPFPDNIWAIDLEDMAGCVAAHTFCDWYG